MRFDPIATRMIAIGTYLQFVRMELNRIKQNTD
jgi:hypothetical protein